MESPPSPALSTMDPSGRPTGSRVNCQRTGRVRSRRRRSGTATEAVVYVLLFGRHTSPTQLLRRRVSCPPRPRCRPWIARICRPVALDGLGTACLAFRIMWSSTFEHAAARRRRTHLRELRVTLAGARAIAISLSIVRGDRQRECDQSRGLHSGECVIGRVRRVRLQHPLEIFRRERAPRVLRPGCRDSPRCWGHPVVLRYIVAANR